MTSVAKVSVALASYNGEKYLREQLDSILTQSYPIYYENFQLCFLKKFSKI